MSRNRSSARKAGSAFEKAVARYLAWALDDPRIERRTRNGAKDRGDINGVMLDGQRVVVECKNTAKLNVPEHLREADEEMRNDDATFNAVVQKRRGIGIDSLYTTGQQLVYMTLEQYALMLNHGQPLGSDIVPPDVPEPCPECGHDLQHMTVNVLGMSENGQGVSCAHCDYKRVTKAPRY